MVNRQCQRWTVTVILQNKLSHGENSREQQVWLNLYAASLSYYTLHDGAIIQTTASFNMAATEIIL